MNRRVFTLASGSALFAATTPVTARQLIARIQQKLDAPPPAAGERTRDTVKCGDPDLAVTGIATTFMATLDVLQRASREGLNFVISHEPTFWHDPEPMPEMADDPLTLYKLEFVRKNRMVVWRQHDQMHKVRPDPIFVGFAKDSGWQAYQDPGNPMRYILPATTVDGVARYLAERLKTRSLRLVGDPGMRVTTVGLGGHALEQNIALLAKCDLVAAFEARERETAEYVRDAVEAGQKKALLLTAHENGEEAGMDEFARWLRTIITEVPVKFIAAGDQFWRS